ncbi:MAG: Ig-like domain-containing protein, partial [Verrucomicrobiota bacterium]
MKIHSFIRRIRQYFPLLIFCIATFWTLTASAAQRTFILSGAPLVLEDSSTNVDVFFTSMRFNRALNVWNVEVNLRNHSTQSLGGPVLVTIESFSGTTGPLQVDGAAQGIPASPFYNLSSLIGDNDLAPGEVSTKRTLSLGFQSGSSPKLTTKIYSAGNPTASALGLVATLDAFGQPLPDVEIAVAGPGGQRTNRTDRAYGVTTVGNGAGANQMLFRRADYLPVWRQQIFRTNEVAIVPFPRLTKRNSNSQPVTPIAGTQMSNAAVQISIPPGAVSVDALAVLTPLTPQTLPALLPAGWSPLQAFWLELNVANAISLGAQFQLWGALNNGETAALVQWNPASLQWQILKLISGNGTDSIATTLPGSGAFALVVGDIGPLSPPLPVVGQALLPSMAATQTVTNLVAGGTVTPNSIAASIVPELVTANAEVIVTNLAGNLPSGSLLRGEISEQYRLRDGILRVPPQFENFLIGYQRPGDASLNTLHATFPVRPLLLFGAEELDEAVVHVEVLNSGAFAGGVLRTNGGQLSKGGINLLAGAGDLAGEQAAELRTLDATNFLDLITSNLTLLRAFDLRIGGINEGKKLALQVQGIPTNSLFVLARVINQRGLFGLQPVERFSSDSLGRLASLETNTTDRLPGINGAGQYILVKVSQPQALVQGVARNSANQPAGGLAVRRSPWLTVSREPDGFFQLISSSGSANVAVNDPGTGDNGQISILVADPNSVSAANLATVRVGPRVVSTSPTNNASGVLRVAPINVVFSKAINPGSFGTNGIVLLGTNSQPVIASLSLNLSGTSATLLPVDPLAASAHFTIVLSTNLNDLSGRRIEGPTTFSFTTESDALNRIGGRLTIYEPTNGVAPMFGSPGTADPESPVILVNETTGATSTILSKPDGSFTNLISADVDDFISAVIVNQNGTRNTIPASRQIFRDGQVGLFRGGGILEALSDGGPVQIIVEPGAIPSKSKFKLEPLTLAGLLTILGSAIPDDAQLLGGFRFSVDGDALKQSADVKFPVNAQSLKLTNMAPEDATFALCEVIEVDGIKMHRMVDRMKYREGNLVTSSPPFEGIGAEGTIGGGLIHGVFANYSIFLMRPSAVVIGRV